jgi:topoisomerase-4 subunit A
MNLTVVGRDGRPGQKGLRDLLLEWVDFRLVSVRRRSQFRLDAVNRRMHILEGRQAVLLNIDEVIRVIREADDPKADLIAAFGLSEIQAEDILEIRLRQLARLEGIKIEKELGELRDERDGLLLILGDEVELKRVVVAEIRADAKKYGDDRRTLIETSAAVTASSADAAIADEPVTVIVSKNGWMRARGGHGLDLAAIQYKAGDSPLAVIETRTVWPLVLLDSAGRSYSIRIADLPTGRGDGVPMSSLLEMGRGARLMFALSAAPETRLLISSDSGYGFICQISDLLSRQRAGKAFLTLEEGGAPLPPVQLEANALWVAAAADNGKLLVFPLDEMKALTGGKGVQIMKLEANERLSALTCFDGQRLQLTGKNRAGKPGSASLNGEALEKYRLHRARKGHELDRLSRVEILTGG